MNHLVLHDAHNTVAVAVMVEGVTAGMVTSGWIMGEGPMMMIAKPTRAFSVPTRQCSSRWPPVPPSSKSASTWAKSWAASAESPASFLL